MPHRRPCGGCICEISCKRSLHYCNSPNASFERRTMSGMSDERLRDVILDSIADGVFTVDGEWTITSFNRAAEEITGIPRDRAVGQQCFDVFRANICQTRCALGTPWTRDTAGLIGGSIS